MVKRELTNRDFERAGIPRRYWGVRFGEIPESAPYRGIVRTYLRELPEMLEEGIGLILFGETNGTGKTGIACLAGKTAMHLGSTVYFIRAQALKDAAIERTQFDEHQTVKQRCLDVDLLIIDDLGKEYMTESGYAESLMEDVLRERVQNQKATHITMNLGAGQIRNVYSKDMAEVLKEAMLEVYVPGPERGGKLWREEKRAALKKRLGVS